MYMYLLNILYKIKSQHKHMNLKYIHTVIFKNPTLVTVYTQNHIIAELIHKERKNICELFHSSGWGEVFEIL